MPILRPLAFALLVTPLFAACATTGVTTPATSGAEAVLKDASGATVGHATARQQGGDLLVTVTASNQTPGAHGAHIHMTGDCTPPGFTTAGGHWNPTGTHHGLSNPQGPHKGDLPNLDVGSDGQGTLSFSVPGASIEGGANALLDADGAAFVIHGGPDDMMSDPAGNSGPRVACGVFVKK